jgi:uncharacterized protein DUF5658
MARTIAAAALTMLLTAAGTGFAVEADNGAAAVPLAVSQTLPLVVSEALTADLAWSLKPVDSGGPLSRGAVLSTLYVSFAALQAYDAYSTMVGLRSGTVEANPVMSGVAGKTATLLAVKAGVTTATILVSERLWKQHRRAQAIAVMVMSNSLMATVAARNSAALRTQR